MHKCGICSPNPAIAIAIVKAIPTNPSRQGACEGTSTHTAQLKYLEHPVRHKPKQCNPILPRLGVQCRFRGTYLEDCNVWDALWRGVLQDAPFPSALHDAQLRPSGTSTKLIIRYVGRRARQFGSTCNEPCENERPRPGSVASSCPAIAHVFCPPNMVGPHQQGHYAELVRASRHPSRISFPETPAGILVRLGRWRIFTRTGR